jgi:hypothetical protein
VTRGATAEHALARTTQLINLDFFGGRAAESQIAAALRRTTVRIRADERNLQSPAGQTALVTLTALTAMLGVDVDLSIPDVPLSAPQPPLCGGNLRTALAAAYTDLIPGAVVGSISRDPELVFVLGDTESNEGATFRLTGDAWRGRVARGPDAPARCWSDSWPLGALAAAGAAAAEVLRSVMPRIANEMALELPDERFVAALGPVAVDLSLPGNLMPTDVGPVDFVSAGAITNAALYALLRIPEIRGEFRVLDSDRLAIENMNRYLLALRRHLGREKARVLASYGSGGLHIEAAVAKLTDETANELAPFAARICVGVDDIPSRWVAQRHSEKWLCVGATSHLDTALVTTHTAGTACAGCAHPPETSAVQGPLPTISFVSFWAGLLQARELLGAAAGVSPTAPSWRCAPYGLSNEFGLTPWRIAPRPDCPTDCAASRAVRAAA